MDPEAAKVVFESGVDLTMVPLEVTHTVLVTPEVLRAVGGGPAEAAPKATPAAHSLSPSNPGPATTTTTAAGSAALAAAAVESSAAAPASTLGALEALQHVPSATRDASGSCPEAAGLAARLEAAAAAEAVSPFRSAICNLLLYFADTYRKVGELVSWVRRLGWLERRA